jgi:hypothetical protein
MKINVLSLTEFDNILKGIVKLVPGCCIEINGLGSEIKLGANGKIRAFIKTTCIKTEDNSEIEICMENISKLINAISFLKDLHTPEQFNLDFDGIYLSYQEGQGKFKLKLDKKERVEVYTTLPLKTTFEDLFSFRLTQDDINFIMKYSNFNPNFEVNGYFYVKNNQLYIDIDNKQEARLSTVSIPLNTKIEGTLDEPVIVDLQDIKNFSLIDKDRIKVCIAKQCVRVLSLRKEKIEGCDTEIKTALEMIVRKLKG